MEALAQKRIHTRIIKLVALLALVGPATFAQTLEPFVLYDTFNAPFIARNKWIAGEAPFLLGLEAARLSGGGLLLATRSQGFTATDSGIGRQFEFLGVPDPEAVTEMKVTVAAEDLQVVGCAGNSTPTQAFAGVIGSFFNAGTPTAGNEIDDVVASIGIFRNSASVDPAGTLRVGGLVAQCADSDCLSFAILASQDFGTIALGASTTVSVKWDRANKQFIEKRAAKPTAFLTYAVSDSESPGRPFKSLTVQNDVANCTTTPRPIARILAIFSSVFLNSSAVP